MNRGGHYADIQDRSAENISVEMVDRIDQIRSAPHAIETSSPLQEILDSVYDLNARDFMPAFNSTLSANDSRLVNQNYHPMENTSYDMNFASGSSVFVSAQQTQASSVPESSMYITPYASNPNSYQSTVMNPYQKTQNNDYMEYLLEQRLYNMTSAAGQVPNQEEDNDPSPVYLNFNLPNMPPPPVNSVQHFNQADLENFQRQIVGNEPTVKDDNSIRYVEYANNIEEMMQNKLAAMSNMQASQVFRQIASNIIPPTVMCRYPVQKIYSVPNEAERMSEAYMAEVLSSYQPINNSICSYANVNSTNINIQRNVISRKPLQTKLTVKQALTNQDWALINGNNNDKNNNEEKVETAEDQAAGGQTINENELSTFSDVDIPFIQHQSIRRCRKQTITPMPDAEMCFIDSKGNVSNYDETLDLVPEEPKLPSYVTIRKKPKIEPIIETVLESPVPESRKSGHRDNSTNSSAILVSSDSDSEEYIDSSDTKCLKCDRCKKMFKTPRSYSIHKKRCDVPDTTADNAYMIEVEYLDSENEDDNDSALPSLPENPHRKESTEFTETDSIDSLEMMKPFPDMSKVTLRRTTRSTQKTTTSSASQSSGSSNSTNCSNSSPKKTKKPKSATNYSLNNNKQQNDDMLTCDVCEKKFRQRSYLMAHKRVHEKSFKCPYCFKSFVVKNAYDSHILERCDKIPALKLKRLRSTINTK